MAEHRAELHQMTDAARAANKISKILAAGAKGGTAGAAVEAAKQYNGIFIGISISAMLMPILIMLLLPAAVFGCLMDSPEDNSTILNDDLAIVENIVAIRAGISEVLIESHVNLLKELEELQKNLTYSEIADIEEGQMFFDTLNILSVYSSFQGEEDYAQISIEHLVGELERGMEDYFIYETSTETRTITVEMIVGGHYENGEYIPETGTQEIECEFTIFTVSYVGDDYFSEQLWPLSDKEAAVASAYTSNLMLYLYEVEEREGISILEEVMGISMGTNSPTPSGVFGNPFNDPNWRSHISSPFGLRTGVGLPNTSSHNGLDLAYGYGTPILCVQNGKVITAKYHPSYGNYIVVDHGGGICTLYAHCSRLVAGVGETVSKGQKIAEVGSTGNSTGNHLHICFIVNGQYVNPEMYLH